MGLARVALTVGAIQIVIETDQTYPDAVQDMANRVSVLLGNGFREAKEAGIDIMKMPVCENCWEDIEEDD